MPVAHCAQPIKQMTFEFQHKILGRAIRYVSLNALFLVASTEINCELR